MVLTKKVLSNVFVVSFWFVLLVSLTISCADTSYDQLDGGFDFGRDVFKESNWPDFFVDGVNKSDAPYIGNTVVYAHTKDTLYKVDPVSSDVTIVAPFVWPQEAEKMTDIAIDKDEQMIGVSQDRIYLIDSDTAECTLLADLSDHFVGLSFVVGTIEVTEFLMGMAKDGSVYEVNPQTGETSYIGDLGGGMKASGDIVSVKGLGTLATVIPPGSETDWLAKLNPETGTATLIGDTGYSGIFGIGFWKNKVFGFTVNNEFVLIDTTTGVSTFVQEGDLSWWGAGVTTVAPVVL